jgi:hypothetical protein
MFLEISGGFVLMAVIAGLGLGEYVACQTAEQRMKMPNRKYDIE